MQELISQLVAEFNVNESQAKGGAGLFFRLAQKQLSQTDLGKLSAALGGGLEALAQQAPAASPSDAGGLLGKVTSALGVGSGSSIGALAQLAGGFKELGLDANMISKFAPVILDFVKSKGGDEAQILLKSVFK